MVHWYGYNLFWMNTPVYLCQIYQRLVQFMHGICRIQFCKSIWSSFHNKSQEKKTRVHTLKCLAFFTNHCYYVDTPKYKALLRLSHKLNMNYENEVKVS